MRFCPRLGCRLWYHVGCLVTNRHWHVSTRRPDASIQDFLDVSQARVDRIPPEILQLACEPIVRGGKHGVVGNVKAVCEAREWAQLYASTPLSGNHPLVFNGNTVDQWLDSLDGIEVEKLIYPDDESDCTGLFLPEREDGAVMPCYTCPDCKKPI
jgi:hypothetical protein